MTLLPKFLPATKFTILRTWAFDVFFAQWFMPIDSKLEELVYFCQKRRFRQKLALFLDFREICHILVKICHFRLRLLCRQCSKEVNNTIWTDCLDPKLFFGTLLCAWKRLQQMLNIHEIWTEKKGTFWLCAFCTHLNMHAGGTKILPKHSLGSKENFHYSKFSNQTLIFAARFNRPKWTSTLKWVSKPFI